VIQPPCPGSTYPDAAWTDRRKSVSPFPVLLIGAGTCRGRSVSRVARSAIAAATRAQRAPLTVIFVPVTGWLARGGWPGQLLQARSPGATACTASGRGAGRPREAAAATQGFRPEDSPASAPVRVPRGGPSSDDLVTLGGSGSIPPTTTGLSSHDALTRPGLQYATFSALGLL